MSERRASVPTRRSKNVTPWGTTIGGESSKLNRTGAGGMNTYMVEVMSDDTVASHNVAHAGSPWEAAEKSTGRAVKARHDERYWVRVTDELTHSVFKYAFN